MQTILIQYIVQLSLSNKAFLQSAFDIIQNRFCALKLVLNEKKKTKFMLFSNSKISTEYAISLLINLVLE